MAGVAGPAAFTAAWTVSALRQDGYSITQEHISGLAAPDARHPHMMTGGFLALGACTTVFARSLEEALGGRRSAGLGPWLVRVAGLGAIAAGVLRRDRMLLRPPDEVVHPQSWRNDGHDLASAVVYAAVVAAPLVLARRCHDDPTWRFLAAPALATAGVTGVLLAVYASGIVERWNGVVQRVAVTLPGAAMAGLAVRLLRHAASLGPGPYADDHQPRERTSATKRR